MDMKSIVFLGASNAARESFWFLKDIVPEVEIVFADDTGAGGAVQMADTAVPVVNDWNFEPHRRRLRDRDPDAFSTFIVAVGEPRVKKIMVEKALARGLRPAPTPIHPWSQVRPDSRVGVGGFIVPFVIMTTNVTVGDFVTVMYSTVGHNNVLGDYTTIYPGCGVAGECRLGTGVLLGTGTVVRPGVTIADWVTTGAQASIIRDITEPGVTVVGVPGRTLERGGA